MIHFNDVQRHYSLGYQRVPALRGVTGTIERGEMVGLCGPSGSGKSTLLNILGMLDTQYQGEIFLEGVAYPSNPQMAAQIRREKLGFIFQKFNLVPVMNALENVAFPLHLNGHSRKAQRARAMDMLELVGLADFAHHRPDHLSGGQQQRVAIARALVHNPDLVIADEPTASLDSETAQKVITLMRDLGHDMGTTFVVATHDPRMACRCDRVIELVDGQLVASESISLRTQPSAVQGALSWVS